MNDLNPFSLIASGVELSGCLPARRPQRRVRSGEPILNDLPDDVRRFLAANIGSVAELEVLLLLRCSRDHAWSAEEVSRALYTAPEMMSLQLAELEAKGLLEASDASGAVYRYLPRIKGLDAVVARVAELYKQRRVAVIALIYSEPVEKARTFADAFRIRKEE